VGRAGAVIDQAGAEVERGVGLVGDGVVVAQLEGGDGVGEEELNPDVGGAAGIGQYGR